MLPEPLQERWLELAKSTLTDQARISKIAPPQLAASVAGRPALPWEPTRHFDILIVAKKKLIEL